MVAATYNRVYFGGGRHSRQPRATSGPGGFTTISASGGGSYSSGDSFVAQGPGATLVSGGVTFDFAFMNVTGGFASASGGAPIGVTSTDPNATSTPVFVQNQPIEVLIVYLPTGGGGGTPDFGATIDSFNQTTGQLFNDDFVTVAPDNGATASGDTEGWVDTTAQAEAITAITPTSSGPVFDGWQMLDVAVRVEIIPGNPITHTPIRIINVAPGLETSGTLLSVAQSTSVSALAFYHTPAQPTAPVLTLCETELGNFNALPVKNNIAILEFYKKALSECSGPQYAAAVAEINALIAEFSGGLPQPRPI